MNFKNKYITGIILIVILIIGSLYYYFSSNGAREEISKSIQMTEEQKLEILSNMSNTSGVTMSETEKEKILDRAPTRDESTSTLSEEEILQFLNKTN